MIKRVALTALAGTLTAGTFTGALYGAPQQRPQQPPVFRTTTELIEIDVVVIDKDGNKVHGLTQDDFILRDRSKPQPIATFTEVEREVERTREAALPKLPVETRVDVASNTAASAGRLVVLMLDDLHVWYKRSDTVKDIARKIVNDLGPESSMALIQTGGEHSVEVTSDRSRLLQAVEAFKGRRPVRRPLEPCDPVIIPNDPETIDASSLTSGCDLQDLNANRGLFQSLDDAARILGAGDKRRKAFILVSENMAKDLSGLFDGGTGVPGEIDRTGVYGEGSVPPQAAPATDWQLLSMMNAMRRGNVATYSIDPRGAVSTQKLAEECFPPASIPDPCVGGLGLIDWNSSVRKAQHGLEIMSEETGGFAVTNTDDFTSGIEDIISDLDNYYLLGFYPEDTTSKGYRKVSVEVKGRPDLKLRYRQGYQVDGAAKPEKETSELNRLVNSALPANDLPLRLHAIPMPGRGKEAKVAIALELTVPTALMRDGPSERLLDDIEYGLYAIDLKGAKVKERQSSGAKIALRPRPGLATVPDQVTYEIVSEMQLNPGQYQLRASATSDKLRAGGSVYLSFDVPDFSKADLMLTDLVLAYADGPHVPIARDMPTSLARTSLNRSIANARAGGSALPPAQAALNAPVLPFDPTLDRTFNYTDTLRLYAQAVQRQNTPLTARIAALAPDGTTIIALDRPMSAGPTPSIDIKLPLAQLTSGAYRLQVSVTDGTRTAVREVGFVIK